MVHVAGKNHHGSLHGFANHSSEKEYERFKRCDFNNEVKSIPLIAVWVFEFINFMRNRV